MRTCLCFVWACVLVGLRLGGARADDSPPGSGLGADAQPAWLDDLPPGEEREWYGWQTLAGDAAGLAAVAGATMLEEESSGADALLLGGLASYMLVAPVSHAAHGRWGAALGSLGLRGLPILVSLASLAEWRPLASDGDGGSGLAALALLAVATPILVDAAVLAYDDVPARKEVSTQVAPWVSRDSGGLLVARRF